MIRILIILVLIALALSGCDWFTDPADETQLVEEESEAIRALKSHRAQLAAANAALDPAGAEYSGFSDAFMQTFSVEHKTGLEPSALSLHAQKKPFTIKATVPVGDGIVFEDGGTGSVSDYPEPGLTTAYEITDASGDVAPNVYMITATTTYPGTNTTVDEYIEEYYVLDEDVDGTWTTDDPIVDDSGSPDQKFRERLELHFDDGSVRYETIVKMIFPNAPELNDGGTDQDGFAAFDILGSLDYPDLAYPVTDLSFLDTASYQECAQGYGMTRADMVWYRDHYLACEADARNPLASPLLAPDLRGLPPALVMTAEFDILRDEGEAYARRRQQAGVPATCKRYDGLIHAFLGMEGLVDRVRDALDDAAAALRAAFRI